jgi:tetratricopeptide (TPR) repeat protein
MRFFTLFLAGILPVVFTASTLLPKVAIAQSGAQISQFNPDGSDYKTELGKLIQEGDAKFQQKDLQFAIAIYQRALQLTKQYRDLDDQVGVLVGLGRVYDVNGQYIDAERSFKEGLKILSELANDFSTLEKRHIQSRLRVLTLTGLGITYTHLGEYAKASENLELAVALSSRIVDVPKATLLTSFEPRFKLAELYYLKLGKYKEAIGLLEQCRIIARQMQDPEKEAIALTAIGNSLVKIGNVSTAQTFYEMAKNLGSSTEEPEVNNAPTRTNAALGEFANFGQFFGKIIPVLRKASSSIREVAQLTSSDRRFEVLGKSADSIDKITQGLSDTITDGQQGNWARASQRMKDMNSDMTEFSRNAKELDALIKAMQNNPSEFKNLNQLTPQILNKLNETTIELQELKGMLGGKQKKLDSMQDLKKN